MFRVDGGFTAFSAFSTCTKSCGGGGTQRRSRSCSNPKPLFGGKDCVGPREETKVCGEIPCPGNNKQLRKYLSFFFVSPKCFQTNFKIKLIEILTYQTQSLINSYSLPTLFNRPCFSYSFGLIIDNHFLFCFYGLFFKLLDSNIGGNTYNLIKSMYENWTCNIKLDDNQTQSFKYEKELRQDCLLSPLLFYLYINELQTVLEEEKVDPSILPDGTKLSSLLYADDLVILSQTATGLQNAINILNSFCNKWKLNVNLKKTKVARPVGEGAKESRACRTPKCSGMVFS